MIKPRVSTSQKIKVEVTCEICWKLFIQKTARQKMCWPKCNNAKSKLTNTEYYKTHKEERVKYAKKYYKEKTQIRHIHKKEWRIATRQDNWTYRLDDYTTVCAELIEDNDNWKLYK